MREISISTCARVTWLATASRSTSCGTASGSAFRCRAADDRVEVEKMWRQVSQLAGFPRQVGKLAATRREERPAHITNGRYRVMNNAFLLPGRRAFLSGLALGAA